jgi:hypothetical protein
MGGVHVLDFGIDLSLADELLATLSFISFGDISSKTSSRLTP